MLVVVESNVLVSALMVQGSPPGEVLRLVVDESVTACYSAAILAEYEDVLLRQRFGFDRALVFALLDHIQRTGNPVSGSAYKANIKHADDEKFAAAASQGNAEYLITGNPKHFARSVDGAKVVSPAEFLRLFRNKTTPAPPIV